MNISKDRLMAYRWAMFISLNNDKALTEHFISKVSYTLHKSYGRRRYEEVTEAPFLLSRTAWGYFCVRYPKILLRCTIHFQPWTEHDPFVLDHVLAFEKQGKVHANFLEAELAVENQTVVLNYDKLAKGYSKLTYTVS